MPSNSADDAMITELLQLQAAELRLTGMYNMLRSNPGQKRETERFLAQLADLNDRASKIEALLEQLPSAIPTSQLLVA